MKLHRQDFSLTIGPSKNFLSHIGTPCLLGPEHKSYCIFGEGSTGMPLRLLTIARLLFSVWKTRTQEDKSNTFSSPFRLRKRYQQNYHRFYIFSFTIYVRSMDVIDQVALHINTNNIKSIKKLNLGLKQQYCLNSLKPIPSHLICKLDVYDLGTALIPEVAEEGEQCLFTAR